MKRFAVALMMVFMTMFVFSTPLDIEEDSNVYWEFEKDVNGQLITYYMFKTDRQFYGNLEFFIKENMNIEYDHCMPNINSFTKNMVSEEFLMNNYPKLYNRWYGDESKKDKVPWNDYKYLLTFMPEENRMSLLMLCKRIDDKTYLSFAMSLHGGLSWIYTNQVLKIMEESR